MIPEERLRPLRPAEAERYARHLTLGEIGVRGQQALRAAGCSSSGPADWGHPSFSTLRQQEWGT